METSGYIDSRAGWWVVFGAFLAQTITAMVAFYVMPVMLDAIIKDTGWTLTEVSRGLTIWGVSAAIFSPLCGMLIDKFGPRRMMLFGTALTFITSFLLARVTALWQLYAVLGVSSIGGMFSTYIPVAAVVSQWFERHRGIATGLAMLGIGVGGAVSPKLVGELLDAQGWRSAYTTIAYLSLIAFVPILVWVRSPRTETERVGDLGEASHAKPTFDLRLREALLTRSFWGLSLGDALTGAVFAVFNLQLVYYLIRDLGDEGHARLVFGVLQFCLAVGVLLFGPLGDRFRFTRVLVLCYFLPTLGVSLLLTPGAGLALGIAFALVAGLPGGGRTALFPMAIVNSFGETHMASIYGASNTCFMIGNAVGPLVGAYIYDTTQNTRIVYAVCAGILVVSAGLVSLIRDERPRRRSKTA